MKRKTDPVAEIVRQLEIRNALLAVLTYQRTGVRPDGFDHLDMPDPWQRLLPYAKALLLLRLEAYKAVLASTEKPSIADALHDLIAVTLAVNADKPIGAVADTEPDPISPLIEHL